MLGNRVEDYNKSSQEADEACANYTAGDWNALGKIAHGCVRLQQVAENDETVTVEHRSAIKAYINTVYKKHPCLVLKSDKIYGYTRNNICKAIRNRFSHTHQPDPVGKNQQKKLNELYKFLDEIPMAVLFCVTSSWIGTPFITPTTPPRDSNFYLKEPYTNVLGEKSDLGIIESIIFNIHDEMAQIINSGKIRWTRHKVIFPFVPSYRNDLEDRLFDEINKTIPFLVQLNKTA